MLSVEKFLFELIPMWLYLFGAIIMIVGVIPPVFHAAISEKEYKPVAWLMFALTIPNLFASLITLLFLFCSFNGCNRVEEPHRGVIRLIIAIAMFTGPMSLFILYNMNRIKLRIDKF